MTKIKYFLIRLDRTLSIFGISPIIFVRMLIGMPGYLSDLFAMKKEITMLDRSQEFPLKLFPCVMDKRSSSGIVDSHYFYQDLLVARRIYQNIPETHIDIGSRFDGFVAHVASFRPIKVLDIRPQQSNIPNIEFVQTDFMGELEGGGAYSFL